MTTVASNEDLISLMHIAVQMEDVGLPASFIANAVRAADQNDGVRGLMVLWADADAAEREKICADIQDLLDDLSDVPVGHEPPQTRPRVSFDDLDDVLGSVAAHKKKLRELIDRHGGVSEVARRSGIPQPSLSRMLSSGSMPRRSTLYRIATALGVSEKEIVGEWVQ